MLPASIRMGPWSRISGNILNIKHTLQIIEALLFRWGECRLNSSSSCRIESEEKKATPCQTVSGPSTGYSQPAPPCLSSGTISGRPCVFPFIYSGKVYTECAKWIHGETEEGEFWCSTKYYQPIIYTNRAFSISGWTSLADILLGWGSMASAPPIVQDWRIMENIYLLIPLQLRRRGMFLLYSKMRFL